jgi:hypothetical protein
VRRVTKRVVFTGASAVVFAICVTITGPVQGEAIYSQTLPAEPVGAFASQDTPSGQKVADNFLIPGIDPVRIRSIRFIGGYGLRNPPPITPPLDALPPDDFQVTFLQDINGSPGPLVSGGEFAIGSAFRRTPTGGRLLNGVEFPIEYVVDLGEGIVLSPATEYWLAITNDAGPAYGWAWARAAGLFDQQTAGTYDNVASGPWNVYVNGGMFFELNDQNIPEPSTLILAIAALATLATSRRRLVA